MLPAAEKRLRQCLPKDVREFCFHYHVQPIAMSKDGDLNEEGPAEFYFYSPDECEMTWHSLAEWVPASEMAA